MPAFANSRRVAVFFLLLSGVVEGLNWLNVSSVFPFFALDLKQNVSALGTITATFLVGEGLFQIPAAIIAGRYSQKRIILYGTAASSVAILLMAFATRIEQIAILRFASGIGMAFTYAPGYILVAKYFDAGSEGTATGMFGAAALFGNVFALIGDSVLPVFVGWRMTLALNGVFGLVVALGLLALLPETRKVGGIVIHDLGSPSLSRMKGILFDRWILAIGSAMLSIEIGSVLASNFMVEVFQA